MRSYWLMLIFALALSPLLAQAPAPVVRDVVYRGFEHFTPDEVLRAVSRHLVVVRNQGTPDEMGYILRPEVGRPWRDDESGMLQRGLSRHPALAKAEVSSAPVLGGVRVLVTVEENPVVLDVAVNGVTIPADLQKAVALLTQRIVGKVLNVDDVATLGWELKTCGLPDLAPSIEPVQGGVRVVFGAPRTPGLVERIGFKGVTVLTEEERQQATAGIAIGKVVSADDLRKAARAVVKLYIDKGYSLATVSGVEVTPDGTAQFTIAEPRIADLRFEGLAKVPAAKAAELFVLKAGDLLHDAAAEAGAQALRDSGLFADVAYAPRILPGGLIQVVVRVKEK